MKYKVVEIKKRRFAHNRLIGWLFLDKWQVTVEFEDGKKQTINLFVPSEVTDLALLMHYIHSKLTTGNQFKEDFKEWCNKHKEIYEKLQFQTGTPYKVVGLSDSI